MSLILSQEIEQGIHLITLNRPDFLNALSNDLLFELCDTLESHNSKVFILTGNKKAFAAGADLKQLSSMSSQDQRENPRHAAWKRLAAIPRPLIAAVDGFCLGAGNELAMLCDIIIASEQAQFGQPEVKVGTIPGAGGTQRLTRALGKSRAMEMILSGEMISAEKAYAWGLVSRVVPQATLIQEALKLAQKIASHSQAIIPLAKKAVNQAYENHLEAGLAQEKENFFTTFETLDQKEGMLAFLEKRKPQYQDR